MIHHPQGDDRQFKLSQEKFLAKLDIINWYRYFFILKELTRLKPKTILEIGPGEGSIKRVFEPFVYQYATMDINPNLSPDFVGDVRTPIPDAREKFDAVVAADILEHIPFEDLGTALINIRACLCLGGHALITIPHRASYFLWMDPRYIPKVIRIPTGFLSPGAFYRRFIKRKIWIDPDHQWEINDGYHTIQDVEKVMKDAGFEIEKRQTLLYVDFWVLKKS